MSLHVMGRTVMSVLLFVFLAVPGAAQSVQSSRASKSTAVKQITLRACNKASETVMVASTYMVIGRNDWRNKGWTTVAPGSCQDIFVTENMTFYARAEVKDDSSQSWGNDIQQCVEYPGPYDFNTGSADTTCPEGEPAGFSTFHSDGTPVYVWNLTD